MLKEFKEQEFDECEIEYFIMLVIKCKNTIGINIREIKMLSTNFCYGGEEIYEIENLKN